MARKQPEPEQGDSWTVEVKLIGQPALVLGPFDDEGYAESVAGKYRRHYHDIVESVTVTEKLGEDDE